MWWLIWLVRVRVVLLLLLVVVMLLLSLTRWMLKVVRMMVRLLWLLLLPTCSLQHLGAIQRRLHHLLHCFCKFTLG